MSTSEKDKQFAANIELIDRVIDPELDGSDFDTEGEYLAYARHLSERELVDTTANRATWIAARSYYDAEASEDKPATGVDREAEQERRLAFLEGALKHFGAELDNLRFRLNEDRIKEMALSLAVQGSSGENKTSIVDKAKAFEAFLSGSEPSS